jgi:hypothetical protein
MSYGSSTAEGYRQVIYVGKILNGARTGALRAALRWPTPAVTAPPPAHPLVGTKTRRSRFDREQSDQLTIESRLCSWAAYTGRAVAGNCSTLARWPSHIRVSSTISPSGNSSAS